MSAPALKGSSVSAMLQDLKSNRRVQVALAVLVLMIWYLWPTAPPTAARGTEAHRPSAPLGDRQSRDLQKLPDLAKLDRAGELPREDRMYRDLFLFDGPPPPPPPPAPPPKPPPPPTAEQLAAEALRQSRAQENGSRPQDLRYLGYLGTPAAGKLGAFMRGEEPVTLKQGDLANPHWRLVKLTDIAAEFQNLKFGDLRHKIDAVDLQGGAGGRTQAPSNDF